MDIAAFNLFTCEELGTWQRGPERAQTATMLRAAIFSAMIALCDGDSGKKNNNHWPFWPPTPDKNMCILQSFGRSQRPKTMENELHAEVRHPMDNPSVH